MRDDNDRRFATAMQTIRWQALGAKKENETKKNTKEKRRKKKEGAKGQRARTRPEERKKRGEVRQIDKRDG